MNVIPAIDLIDGKCVRLTQGDYAQKKIYHEDPVAMARQFEEAGFKRLHLVDLDGAKAQHPQNLRVLEEIVRSTELLVDFGGGIKTAAAFQEVFDAGAHQLTVGTLAVKNRELFLRMLQQYGSERLILGADTKAGTIAIEGWEAFSEHPLIPFIESYVQEGVQYVLCTDVAKDGLLQGSSIEIYRDLRKQFPSLKIIASGGVTSEPELLELREIGVWGAVVGKAFYEERLDPRRIAQVFATKSE